MSHSVTRTTSGLKRHQRGQAYVEYIVATVFLIAALYAPVFNGESAMTLLIAAFQANQESYVWAMSVPD
ncbi:hypothetical protein MWU49_09535 [Alcanivorax sp. S6407]|uniref:hypothetical protein n=1 Tax=Alcanivorax sp. S6407 TaxID=2926424 RepID=UPI001FF43E2A|nr:hypothetical protein [Alcanivorax sp. S6407]MCK0153944.1 hypothetical protein [Alcanivorax sp. S6407]